ncbi:uracil-DNA glycosylase [Dehalococcoidia bacterium]|nr:uracil-DNA glycosylase [Dehalococcoidia bacterium]
MEATEEQYIWFRDLAQRAYDCLNCPRMEANTAVLGPLNGRLESRVVFVGEAPGRFGAAATRVPFHGDRSGKNFEMLLPHAGLQRENIFITNAVLCNPKDHEGRNDRPTTLEVGNCSSFLREILDIIQPRYVVALGQIGLDALNILTPHKLTLKVHVARAVDWRGVKVIPLYHPSARAMVHRPFAQQVLDYRKVHDILAQNLPVDEIGVA